MDIDKFAESVDPREQTDNGESVHALVERIEGYLFGSFDCNECGTPCKASTTYDPTLYEEVRSWECPNCQSEFYREDMYGDDRLPQPSER